MKQIRKIIVSMGAIIALYGAITLVALVLVSVTNDETDLYGQRCTLSVDESQLAPLLSQTEIKESTSSIRCNTVYLTLKLDQEYSAADERGFLIRLSLIKANHEIPYDIDVCILGSSPVFAKLLDDGTVSYVGAY